MTTVLLVIHLFVTLALIGLVLLQRSEGGGLGIGSSGGMGSFMGGRGTANLLTRGTAILGTLFFVLALALALLNRGASQQNRSILDSPPPASAPAAPGRCRPFRRTSRFSTTSGRRTAPRRARVAVSREQV